MFIKLNILCILLFIWSIILTSLRQSIIKGYRVKKKKFSKQLRRDLRFLTTMRDVCFNAGFYGIPVITLTEFVRVLIKFYS